MANRFDAEMVVSGDASLWRPQWGALSMHIPPSRMDRMLGLPADILGTEEENSNFTG
jgi:hypothetical protein